LFSFQWHFERAIFSGRSSFGYPSAPLFTTSDSLVCTKKVCEEMNSIGPVFKKNLSASLLRFLTIFAAITWLCITLSIVALLGVGYWLVQEDPVQKSSAIVVLTGGLPTRALEAADLYRDGYAKEIWLTHPGEMQDSTLEDLGIHYPSEDEFNVQVLKRSGVPAKAIHVLDTPIVNTADELNVISATLKSRGVPSVIIVTSKSHTRRVRELWNKYHSSSGVVMVHATSDDEFEPSRWWKTTGGTMQVFHELLGMANAWAGLPVQPASHARASVASNDARRAPVLQMPHANADTFFGR